MTGGRRAAAVVACAALVAACGAPHDDAREPSPEPELGMVEGRVVSVPTCNVRTCPPRPLVGARVLALSEKKVEERSVTDRNGEFAMRLPPGRYTVEARAQIACEPVAVQVTATRSASITIVCTTGIV